MSTTEPGHTLIVEEHRRWPDGVGTRHSTLRAGAACAGVETQAGNGAAASRKSWPLRRTEQTMGHSPGPVVRAPLGWTAAGVLPLTALLALLPPEGRAVEGAAQTIVTTESSAAESLVCPGPECLPVDVVPAPSSTLSQTSTPSPSPSPESVPSTAQMESADKPPSTIWNRPTLTGD
jgi:hypothetical protein